MEGDALFTISAFMLLAGVWHGRRDPESLIPQWQLETVGFTSWRRMESDSIKQPAPSQIFSRNRVTDFSDIAGRQDRRLSDAIRLAISSGSPSDTADAVALGCEHRNRLVRLTAQISALDIFRVPPTELDALRQQYANDDQPLDHEDDLRVALEGSLEAVLRRRLRGDLFHRELEPAQSSHVRRPSGLILIHGTNMPGCRPAWSVPHTGELFKYIQSALRPDVYADPDYFRWEGGYSHYAREWAANRLAVFIAEKRLCGVDAVTHSHGGNVLLLATHLGCDFGDVLLLSCPVRPRKYKLNGRAVRSARSLRVNFDFIILADRCAGQEFPPNSGIHEQWLPYWYFGHSATTKAKVWNDNEIRI